jgi:hypothetical protein
MPKSLRRAPLTTKDRAADAFLITAITGLWNGIAITGLEAPHSCCSPPGWNNNVLLDGRPELDKGGIAFSRQRGEGSEVDDIAV